MHNYTEYYFEWIECWRIILLLVFVKAPLKLHAANNFTFSFPFSWCLWQPALSLSLTSSLSPEGNWRRCSHSPRKRWTSMPVSCFPPVSLSLSSLFSPYLLSPLSLLSPSILNLTVRYYRKPPLRAVEASTVLFNALQASGRGQRHGSGRSFLHPTYHEKNRWFVHSLTS